MNKENLDSLKPYELACIEYAKTLIIKLFGIDVLNSNIVNKILENINVCENDNLYEFDSKKKVYNI